VYLLQMAYHTQAPVFSVNYTLAPEAQHPMQLHQCLTAYFWARANAAYLGWKGGHALFIGDSAGGNLVTSMHARATSSPACTRARARWEQERK
jgi:acetyl esterase/lipase